MPTTPPPSPPAPAATRLPVAGWRDPRLILGTLIVAGSVLLGSAVVAASDDTVTVWGLANALPAGALIDDTDLEPRQVRFADGSGDRYLRATASVAGRTLARAVGAGELLPAAAIARTAGPAGVQLPLTVEDGALPASIRPGSVVDVWVAPRDPVPGGTHARRVLQDVTVIDVPEAADPLAPASSSTVLLAVPADEDVAAVLGATVNGRVVLTVRGES